MKTPFIFKIILVCAATLISDMGMHGADYYVAKSGNDGDTGGADDPFKTISRAAEVAMPGDTVWIGPGTYRETVRPAHSGEPGNPIVFRSLTPEEPAVINGADVVAGPWTKVGDGDVYMADWVGDYVSINMQADQVFVEGEMYDLLRWPKEINNDLTHPNEAEIDDIIEYTIGVQHGPMTIVESDFDEPDGRWDGARVYVNISPPGKGDGQGQTGWIVSTDQSEQTITWQGIDDRSKSEIDRTNNWHVLPGNYYYLFDPTPEGLEATGGAEAALGEREWWLNRETRKLYVRMPEGAMPDYAVEVKRRDWGFDLSDMSYITVRDMKLFATSITTDPDPTGAKPQVTPSTGVMIDGLTIWYVTHFTNMDADLDYQGSWMGQSGVILSGSNHTIRNCEFYWSAGSCLSVTGVNHRVYNNLMEDFNYNVTEAAGINMSKDRVDALSLDHKVGYNTLRSSTGSGIFFRPAMNSDPDRPGIYRIHHNRIYDVLHRITDAGILTTVGANLQGGRLDHNILHGGNGYIQFGIYVDFGGGLYIDHNVAYDCWSSIGGNEYENILLNNNVAIQTPVYHPFQPDGIRAGVKGIGPEGNVSLYNNISSGNLNTFSSGTREANITGLKRNLYPMFVNASDENFVEHDYSLVETATEAIDQGVIVPGYDDPWVGDAPDIGAYEYGRESWQAGHDAIPWYLDDHDTLRFAAQDVTVTGLAVLHPFTENAPVTGLTVVESSPGVTVELLGTSVAPDQSVGIQFTVSETAPAPSTGWFILEGTQGDATHQQNFTFIINPKQELDRIEWEDEWEEPVVFFPYETVTFDTRFYDTEGKLMTIEPEAQWSLSGGGWISQDGVLTTFLSQGGPFTLTVQSGEVSQSIDFTVEMNWAYGQPASASSKNNDNVPASNAVDDNDRTPWASVPSDDQWIAIELGELVTIETVEIDWHARVYATSYQLEISQDGETWTSFLPVELDSGGLKVHDGLSQTGRYLRIHCFERAESANGVAIYTVKIYGDSALDILGTALTEPAGWRWSDAVGWFYDETPGTHPHMVYIDPHGWQYINGPGLFLRGKEFWAFDFTRNDWWWYYSDYGRIRYMASSGWEDL